MRGGEEGPGDNEPEEGLEVGFSVGDYANPWRRQHMDVFEQQVQLMVAEGTIEDYEMRAAGTSVTDQASDIRGLADQGMDLIVVNPQSRDGLNSAIEYAHDAGATIVTTDQNVTSEYATNVHIDQEEWFADITEAVCEELDGEGDIVMINGIPGSPANEDRINGADRVLEDYPDINVLERIDGNWYKDHVQDVYAGTLAEHGAEIDGILSQDGMIQGAIWAYEEAGINYDDPKFPDVMTGDHTMGYLRNYWLDLRDNNIFNYMRTNPPGYYAQASLQIGLRLAQGENLDTSHPRVDTETYPGTTVWLELGPAITNNNVEEFIQNNIEKQNTYRIDSQMSDEEADEFFE